jgi:hypothetical protein
MARGFESKSVADQQEQAESPGSSHQPTSAHLRRLELSRADVRTRLKTAQVEAHREMLQRALEALDEEIASLS